ncbi:ubiquitin carboxyl-terminal hydrolase 5 isoform X1 [Sitophilus oryzae]|uniref:Ubiquitin carboxyl-terminal hydrolase n=1 Tax=Sitophilus oryzae TaxID=7048 RepID=A0A6J2X5N5_SITOR|nr:ubiquitin carboxyl-terminal hydrolase 5 isoform X1 [Sitophilus oryzae]
MKYLLIAKIREYIMEQLQPHVKNIKIPTENDKVYKDECVYSFDSPESPTGLYIGLTTFIGLGRNHVERHFKKTGEAVYLHLKRICREVSSPTQGDGPEKKITRLAIGVEGGFDPESGKKKFEFEDSYKIVILPGFLEISWPKLEFPEVVLLSVKAIIDLPSASKLAELEALSGTWDGETRQVSKHAQSLVQLENGKKIPPTGWTCEKCDKTENLWLNLSDGSVLCGRKFFDGSGGNNHAIEHYSVTNYPLAVKLGTITKDGKADVFSYSEDDMVEDPLLAQHLQHFGINISQMEKTEKSMVELELELNQKTNEWSALCESGGKLKPIYGPGYTGMQNMGNSCYLNSIMQVIYRIPDFVSKYFEGCEGIFDKACGNPAEDFSVQMAKLAYGLLSGDYSVPPDSGVPVDADPPGITPHMFKTLVGKGHPEFSTKKQQDVQEFLLHLLTLLERHNNNSFNPGECFKFEVEERFQCGQSKMVKYITRSEVCLSLNIPMDAAINKEEVANYEARKSEAESHGKRLDPESIVRPKIKFFSCLESFTQSEVINSFFSSAVNGNVSARKTTRLATFPDYLVIQLKKFTLREDWVPIKLDVSVEMPDVLDISVLRGTGPQPGEELLPEPDTAPPAPQFDEAVLAQLCDMGFPLESCKRALYQTGNKGVEVATAWIMEHITDPDFTDPFIPPGTEPSKSSFAPNPEALATIISMGFTENQASKALKNTDNNVERAMDWIFSHVDDMDTEENDEAAAATASHRPKFRDGNGKYKLIAFISHMGTSTMVGHYVAHIQKEGQWVIFNDSKVALSEHPPKDLGYLYIYERL